MCYQLKDLVGQIGKAQRLCIDAHTLRMEETHGIKFNFYGTPTPFYGAPNPVYGIPNPFIVAGIILYSASGLEYGDRLAMAGKRVIPLNNLIPIDDIPPLLDVFISLALVFEIVCMFPDVQTKNRNHLRFHNALH